MRDTERHGVVPGADECFVDADFGFGEHAVDLVPDDEVGIGQFGRIEIAREELLIDRVGRDFLSRHVARPRG